MVVQLFSNILLLQFQRAMCYDTHVYLESLRVYHVASIFYSLFTRSHFFQNRKGIPPLHIFLFCMYNLNVISFTQKSMLLYWNRVIYNAISKNIPDNPSCTGVSSHFSSTNEVKQSSIFQLPQKRFDHCVKYKKQPCILCPC